MDEIIRHLLDKAFLFDDPDAYASGVQEAVRALGDAGLVAADIDLEHVGEAGT
jgi:hypothetical protein